MLSSLPYLFSNWNIGYTLIRLQNYMLRLKYSPIQHLTSFIAIKNYPKSYQIYLWHFPLFTPKGCIPCPLVNQVQIVVTQISRRVVCMYLKRRNAGIRTRWTEDNSRHTMYLYILSHIRAILPPPLIHTRRTRTCEDRTTCFQKHPCTNTDWHDPECRGQGFLLKDWSTTWVYSFTLRKNLV